MKASHDIHISRHFADLNEEKLQDHHLAFMDLEYIYSSIQQLKAERNWYNLNISQESIKSILTQSDWYTLYIPAKRMKLDSFDQVMELQEIAIALLKKYCDRFYKSEQDAFEAPHRKYAEIDPSDPISSMNTGSELIKMNAS